MMNGCPATHGVKLTERRQPQLLLFDDRHGPRQRVGWHAHDLPCITYLYEGSYTESYRNSWVDCIAPSVLVKPGGEAHKDFYCPVGARSLVLVLEHMSSGDLDKCLQRVTYLDHMESTHAGERLRREFVQWDDASPMIVDGLVREIVNWTLRRSAPIGRRDTLEHWIDRVRERLYREYDQSVTVTELAHGENVHPDHLTRVFKKRFRMLPGEYLRCVRLARAHRAVVETTCALKDIAHDCGFSDQSHLTRLFKIRYGVTPARLRRMESRGKRKIPGTDSLVPDRADSV